MMEKLKIEMEKLEKTSDDMNLEGDDNLNGVCLRDCRTGGISAGLD
jgi:hypothetical protein